MAGQPKKPIVQLYPDGKFYARHGSMVEAVRAGYDANSIKLCCKGKRPLHKGYQWKYEAEYEAKKK